MIQESAKPRPSVREKIEECMNISEKNRELTMTLLVRVAGSIHPGQPEAEKSSSPDSLFTSVRGFSDSLRATQDYLSQINEAL
jgi:hypothetical protein